MNRWERNNLIRKHAYGPALYVCSRLLFLIRAFVPSSFYRLDRPIFVVGCSRSGTTIFMEYFRDHPDLCDWSEAAQVMELDFYNPQIDHEKVEADATEFEAFRIQFLFGLKTRLLGRKRFTNKHPENSFRMRFIKTIFPDAMFLHVIRDGRAVASSNYVRTHKDRFRTGFPFGQFPKPPNWRSLMSLPLADQFAHQWIESVRCIRNVSGKYLRPGQYMEVQYEEFCGDPIAVLARIDEFFGLDPSRRKLDTGLPRLDSQNAAWAKAFTTEEAKRVEELTMSLNRDLGYLPAQMRTQEVAV